MQALIKGKSKLKGTWVRCFRVYSVAF